MVFHQFLYFFIDMFDTRVNRHAAHANALDYVMICLRTNIFVISISYVFTFATSIARTVVSRSAASSQTVEYL